MTNIVASVGSTSQPATQQPNTCREAIFSGTTEGSHAVFASSSAASATPGAITVTVERQKGAGVELKPSWAELYGL